MQIPHYIRSFQSHVTNRDWDRAFHLLVQLLSGFGQEDERFVDWCHDTNRRQLHKAFTQFAATITDLMVNPAAQLSAQDSQRLTSLAPELSHVFLLSGYGDTDHILEELTNRGTRSTDNETVFADTSDARKFLLLSSVYGRSMAPLIALFRKAPQPALSAVLSTLSSHVTCTERAQRHRNELLAALELGTGAVPTQSALTDLHRAWTLCSYATTDDRHDAKKHLNQMIRNWLGDQQIAETPLSELTDRERPTMVVACEVTGGGHVMSRCYEPFLEQLQQRFRVITLVAEGDLGDDKVPWCDELVTFSWSQTKFVDVVERVRQLQPDVIYYPCLGMRLWTVIACNMRLAPLQIASLGHPATTNSPHIDYMVGGRTTGGDANCYSERLVALDSPGNLYRLNRDQESFPRDVRTRPAPVRIAVCANMLKLNADFVGVCGEIAERAERAVEFVFMPNCVGLKYLMARQQVIERLAQRAAFRVLPRQRCADYLQNLGLCDIYLSPFPFGGENSTLDALLQGLPAVTLSGPQPHSRLDARVMETAGLPDWLVAKSVEAYQNAALRLINDDDSRTAITRQLLETDLEQRFAEEHHEYAGDFVEKMWSIYQESLATAK